MQAAPPISLQNLLRGGHVFKYKKGQIVQSSDGQLLLMLVKKGYIMRYQISDDGTIGIQSIYGPNDVFSMTLIFKEVFDYDLYNGPEIFFYEAMCDTEVYTLPIETLKGSLKNNTILYRDLLMVSGGRLRVYVHQLENMSLKNSHKRVAHQLAFFAREFGSADDFGVTSIMIPMTQQTLGDVLSLTRETVSQSISFLRKNGFVKVSRRTSIPDIDKLEKFAHS